MRMIGIALGAALGLAAGTAAAAPVYSPATGSYYDYINRNLADTAYTEWTWEEARADAASRTYMGRQGRLVTITSQAEDQFLVGGDVAVGLLAVWGRRERSEPFLPHLAHVEGLLDALHPVGAVVQPCE